MRESWRDVAHLLRLAALFAVGILAFLVLRAIFVPAGFGELGHFRSGAMGDNAARPLSYAGRTTCADCHDQEAATLAGSAHARIGCESCHGPLATHAADPDAVTPTLPVATPLCERCHAELQARPARQPQVDPGPHADGADCTDCHQPHDPTP